MSQPRAAERLGHEGQRRALDRLAAALQRRGFYGGVFLRFDGGHLIFARVERTLQVDEIDAWAEADQAAP